MTQGSLAALRATAARPPSRSLVTASLGLAALIALVGPDLAAVELPRASLVALNPIADGDSLASGGAAVVLDAEQGLLLSLSEVVSADQDLTVVVLPGGQRREARVVKRGASSGAVLLKLGQPETSLQSILCADSRKLVIGDTVWSLGNPYGALALDGQPALSRGVVSGIYEIPSEAPPVRGRGGAILSEYRGPVIETDAAVNDGNQGGALLDDAGRLVAICSLGVARQRRVGTAVPIHHILTDLALDRELPAPAMQTDPLAKALQQGAAQVANSVVLVYLMRPNGPGNPRGLPRPKAITDTTPSYQRKRLKQQWERYYHEQQVFYTDQAVSAIVIDPAEGLLLTAASNLHGRPTEGMILAGGQLAQNLGCKLVARHEDQDLAVLKADQPLPHPAAPLADRAGIQTGDPIGIVGKHRDGGPYTLTTGVASARQRYIALNGHFRQTPHPWHQTDALANYGNLGGPIIDVHGRVVGLLTRLGPGYDWKINSGVAVFVHSDTIQELLPDLMAGTSSEVPSIIGLGVQSREHERGVTIVKVVEGTGAADAGLLVGDIILAINGQDIVEHLDLQRLLVRRAAGEIITLRVEREGEVIHLDVELRLF